MEMSNSCESSRLLLNDTFKFSSRGGGEYIYKLYEEKRAKYTYCDNHFKQYMYVKSLCSTP